VNPDLVASIITALVSLILGVLSFISASHAKHHEAEADATPQQAERSAYERAAALLTEALDRCRDENRELREQINRLGH
jgi:hypothetical protein